MNVTIAKDLAAIDDLFALVEGFACREGLAEEATFQLTVTAEELFTNLVKYNTDGHEPVGVRLERIGNCVELEFTDRNVAPYDITHHRLEDLDVPIEKRRPGGMGLHLVMSLMDEVAYRHENGNSIITVRKNVPPADKESES